MYLASSHSYRQSLSFFLVDMQVGNGDFDGRQEKLSFKKELKKKCQENRYEIDTDMHKIGSISVAPQPGIFCLSLLIMSFLRKFSGQLSWEV